MRDGNGNVVKYSLRPACFVFNILSYPLNVVQSTSLVIPHKTPFHSFSGLARSPMYFSACAVVVLLAGLAVMPLPGAAGVARRHAKIGGRCTGAIHSYADVSAAEICPTINIYALGIPFGFILFSPCLTPPADANQIYRSRWENPCNFCTYRCNNQPTWGIWFRCV